MSLYHPQLGHVFFTFPANIVHFCFKMKMDPNNINKYRSTLEMSGKVLSSLGSDLP
jgi:hypothetical protein